MSKVAVFLATGFEEIEALTVVDLLRRVHITTDMVSVTDNKKVVGSHGIAVDADMMIQESALDTYDMLILPGGMPGTLNLEACETLMMQADAFYAQGKWMAAICAAPSILGHRGMLKGKKACCYPGFEKDLEGAEVSYDAVCVDNKIITSRGMGCAIPFGLKVIEVLLGEEASADLSEKIIY